MKNLLSSIVLLNLIYILSAEEIELNWTKSKNAVKYSVFISTGILSWTENLGNTNKYKLSLKPGYEYVIKIIPYNKYNERGPLSNTIRYKPIYREKIIEMTPPILTINKEKK